MAGQETREARALSMLEEVTKELRVQDSNLGIARELRGSLRSKLDGLIGELETPSRTLEARLRSTRGELARLRISIEESCSAGLADFYVRSAALLIDRPSRSMLRDALAGGGASREIIPHLFQAITHQIEISGYESDLDDLRVPLNSAGEQLIALLLESERWPVLVAGGSEAPVIGPTPDAQGTSTLERMRQEVSRISKAEGVIEMREPRAAMASMMESLSSWLPFRTVRRGGPSGTTGGSSGTTGSGSGGGGDGGGRHGGKPPPNSGRPPNFTVDTNDPDCAVSWRINFLRPPFRAFGGPLTPAHNYLAKGYYQFKVYNAGNEYFTTDPVKVPENSPLKLPFPPIP